jgi:hypothetical protein
VVLVALAAARDFREQGFHIAIHPHLSLALTRARITDETGSSLPLARSGARP